jgi:subtilisin family serine protease
MKKYLSTTLVTFFVTLFLWGCSDILESEKTNLNINAMPINNSILSSLVINDSYYWYHGKKISISPTNGKFFILYHSYQKEKLDFKNTKVSGCENSVIMGLEKVTTDTHANDYNWAIIEDFDEKQIKELKGKGIITYYSPYYISSIGNNKIGISNLFYVKLKNEKDIKLLKQIANEHKVEILGRNKKLPLWFTLACYDSSSGNAVKMANTFYESGLFDIAEPDIMVELSQGVLTTPNDQYYSNQWNLYGYYSINWENASSYSTGSGVNIGLIDQGVESLHPDLPFIPTGYDAYANSWYGGGIYGAHGTACAGIIAAKKNNNIGIVGIASSSNVTSYSDPLTERPNIAQDLASDLYIAIYSSDVVSCSWGGNSLTSSLIEDVINYHQNWGRNGKGTIIVFASGNDNTNVSFPANCNDNLIVVGAMNMQGYRASFSNYGSELDVVAPGVNIPTTDLLGNSGYTSTEYNLVFEGTSAACPHVSAIASLILSINPNLTNSQVSDIIESTARKVGGYSYNTNVNRPNGTWNNEMGYGLVNAEAAVLAAQQTLTN